MIKNVKIKNFKSIMDLVVVCKNLNLIAGTNSSGKSTFIQTLLLPKQFIDEKDAFNGRLVELGDPEKVICYYSGDKNLKVEMNLDNDEVDYIYKYSPSVSSFQICGFKNDNYNIEYLSCDRIGAQSSYKKNHAIEKIDIGKNGEFAIPYLEKFKDIHLNEDVVADPRSSILSSQVNYWLQYITGANIETYDINSTSVGCNYNINGKYCSPNNVGAGHSYVISIIIMCLLSKNDDVIIVEDPEIHLHPNAQSKLFDFLYYISTKNRQLFIETHSDHLFNAIRAGIAQKRFSTENVCVNYFYLFENKYTKNLIVDFGENGSVLNMKDGLFDQFDKDLNRMLGL